MEELKFPIRYLEIEVLFGGLDQDKDAKITLEELKSKLDAPVPVVKVDVDASALRRAIYKFMREKTRPAILLRTHGRQKGRLDGYGILQVDA